jgi:hypothetical protein
MQKIQTRKKETDTFHNIKFMSKDPKEVLLLRISEWILQSSNKKDQQDNPEENKANK